MGTGQRHSFFAWDVWAAGMTIAWRNLIQAKRRTRFLALAIALVACLFVILRTVSQSIAERMIESATTLSAGHVNVGGFFKSRRKASEPILTERGRLRSEVKAIVPEATAIIDRHRGWGRLISPRSSFNVGVSGLLYDEELRFFNSLRLAPEYEYQKEGTSATHGDFASLREPDSVLLFAAQAKKLEVAVGDTVTFVTEGTTSGANTVDLKVKAIVSDIGFLSNWNIFVPRATVLNLYRMAEDTTGAIMVYLPDPSQANAVMERLRSGLKARGHDIMDYDPNPFYFKFEKVAGEDWLGQKIDLTIWSDEISFVLWITQALDLVAFFVIGILAVIILGGILNAVWMSVRERTKEIGTVRAMGAQKSFIVQIFVCEAGLLGLMASSVGVMLAVIGMSLINGLGIPIKNDGARLFLMASEVQFVLHPGQWFVTIVLFGLMTAMGALYPAFKASRLRPVDALMQSK